MNTATNSPPDHVYINAFIAGSGISILAVLIPFLLLLMGGPVPGVFVGIISLPAYLVALAFLAFRFGRKYPSVSPLAWTTLINGVLMLISFFVPGIFGLMLLAVPCILGFVAAFAGRRRTMDEISNLLRSTGQSVP